MEKRDIIIIGASAGGIGALSQLIGSLPKTLPASIFIVQHLAPYRFSNLPEILSRAGTLNASHPKDGQNIEIGKVYVAPPNQHLLLENNKILIKKGPKENRFRPSIDALMRSAAYYYGPRVIGIVLTGMLDDGTSGIWSIKRLGGMTIVQNPQEAEFSSMPENVLEYVDVDHILPINEISNLLIKVAGQAIKSEEILKYPDTTNMKKEIDIAADNKGLTSEALELGNPSHFTCPECGGSLTEINEGKITRFRCHTGHAYSNEALLEEAATHIDTNLASALRSMNEFLILLNETIKKAKEMGENTKAKNLLNEANKLKDRTASLNKFIQSDNRKAVVGNLQKGEKAKNEM